MVGCFNKNCDQIKCKKKILDLCFKFVVKNLFCFYKKYFLPIVPNQANTIILFAAHSTLSGQNNKLLTVHSTYSG